MNTTRYFKFESQKELESTLDSLNYYSVTDEGDKVYNYFQNKDVFIVITGKLLKYSSETEFTDGYHMDAVFSGETPDELVPYEIFPKYPKHVVA